MHLNYRNSNIYNVLLYLFFNSYFIPVLVNTSSAKLEQIYLETDAKKVNIRWSLDWHACKTGKVRRTCRNCLYKLFSIHFNDVT